MQHHQRDEVSVSRAQAIVEEARFLTTNLTNHPNYQSGNFVVRPEGDFTAVYQDPADDPRLAGAYQELRQEEERAPLGEGGMSHPFVWASRIERSRGWRPYTQTLVVWDQAGAPFHYRLDELDADPAYV